MRSPHVLGACGLPVVAGLAFLNGIGADFQAPHHEIHHAFPTLEVQITGQRFQMLEEPLPPPERGANLLVTLVGEFQERVQSKGQQVHRDQEAGEVLLAVSEVVLQVIAPILEHVIALVLDLPAGASSRHQARYVVGADRPVGDEGVAVADFALRVGDGHFAPVDLERVLALGERHVVGPAIKVVFPAVGFAFGAQLQGLQRAAGLQSFDPGTQMGVGSGLAGEQKMEPVQERLAAEGLMGVEIIAQQGVVACVVALGALSRRLDKPRPRLLKVNAGKAEDLFQDPS